MLAKDCSLNKDESYLANLVNYILDIPANFTGAIKTILKESWMNSFIWCYN